MEFNNDRYSKMQYVRSGNSGLKLPRVSLGLWHNFGDFDDYENAKSMAITAFDAGITHFDIANNYGPPVGSAEVTFSKMMKTVFAGHRDEMIISTKAGYPMWDGPYGDGGSKKYLTASLDQSLKRTGLEYVDIFYHHRPDENTPVEETMNALSLLVKQGKALYVGLSNYKKHQLEKALPILRQQNTPCVIDQIRYNMLDRVMEDDTLPMLKSEGVGSIIFSPLAKGILTDKYLKGIPADSRAANPRSPFLKPEDITKQKRAHLNELNEIALQRGQSLAQMALSWVMRNEAVTSVLIGASRPQQITDCIGAMDSVSFSAEELKKIDMVCGEIIKSEE